ncbi:hypothetical protein LBMAG48_29250 [Phycisphaerae bacterium]|nr:hypothetical protein LBMAG48_29250 [Phycisphaerae bacterium]
MTIASRFAFAVCLIAAGSAQAERDIRVTVTGQVESNGFASGTFAGLGAGTPVVMTIDLDSTDFLDSPHLPGRTRGYRFGPTNFSLRVGNVVTTLRSNPQPAAYFVLRNDDPRVDGFFLSQGTDIDTQIPLAMTPNNFGIAFSRTFGNVPPVGPDPTLGSLRLYDAIGTWGFENISSYNFTIELNENVTPLLFAYETITIASLCGDIDVNNNGVFPEDADVIAFFDVLAGGECAGCDDIDFNNNGVYPEDLDVIDFFNVLAGGDCAN